MTSTFNYPLKENIIGENLSWLEDSPVDIITGSMTSHPFIHHSFILSTNTYCAYIRSEIQSWTNSFKESNLHSRALWWRAKYSLCLQRAQSLIITRIAKKRKGKRERAINLCVVRLRLALGVTKTACLVYCFCCLAISIKYFIFSNYSDYTSFNFWHTIFMA